MALKNKSAEMQELTGMHSRHMTLKCDFLQQTDKSYIHDSYNIKSFKGREKTNDKKKPKVIPCKFGKKCRNAAACNYYHAENDGGDGKNENDNDELRMIDNERNGRRNIGKLLSEASGESKV